MPGKVAADASERTKGKEERRKKKEKLIHCKSVGEDMNGLYERTLWRQKWGQSASGSNERKEEAPLSKRMVRYIERREGYNRNPRNFSVYCARLWSHWHTTCLCVPCAVVLILPLYLYNPSGCVAVETVATEAACSPLSLVITLEGYYGSA